MGLIHDHLPCPGCDARVEEVARLAKENNFWHSESDALIEAGAELRKSLVNAEAEVARLTESRQNHWDGMCKELLAAESRLAACLDALREIRDYKGSASKWTSLIAAAALKKAETRGKG